MGRTPPKSAVEHLKADEARAKASRKARSSPKPQGPREIPSNLKDRTVCTEEIVFCKNILMSTVEDFKFDKL